MVEPTYHTGAARLIPQPLEPTSRVPDRDGCPFSINLRIVLRFANKHTPGQVHPVLRAGKKMLRVVNFNLQDKALDNT
jgi:hypothetical protein